MQNIDVVNGRVCEILRTQAFPLFITEQFEYTAQVHLLQFPWIVMPGRLALLPGKIFTYVFSTAKLKQFKF